MAAIGEERYEDVAEIMQPTLQKAPLLYFDFVEFFGGAGMVSACASEIGMSVAPPIDLDASQFYNFTSLRLLEWCLYMVEHNRFRSFLTEPPCTSFSAAAHPMVRSYSQPLGFCRTEGKTLLGNTLAFRGITLLRAGRKWRRPCGLEQPRRSKLCWTHHWKKLVEDGFQECILASCQFGSKHKKEFVFIFYLLDARGMEVKCPGGHLHVKIEGSLTKPSAVYVRDLAMHVAVGFKKVLLRIGEDTDHAALGYESALVNDVLISKKWSTVRAWHWKRKSHINELESSAAASLVAQVARDSPSSRFCDIVDSRVALGSLAKGRSSSLKLNRICRRVAALAIGGDVYPGWLFGPTRLNTADDPTRLVDVRAPAKHSILERLTLIQAHHLHASLLPRPLSGWVRLFILLGLASGTEGFGFDHSASCSVDFYGGFPDELIVVSFLRSVHLCLFGFFRWLICVPLFSLLDLCGFGSTQAISFLTLALWCGFLLMLGFPFLKAGSGVRWIIGRVPFILVCVVAAPLQPCSYAEQQRASTRSLTDLVASRVVRPETRVNRENLLRDFQVWLYEDQGISLSSLLTAKPPDAEEICRVLVEYGKQMFAAGRAYGKYAETINAIGAARPFVKKHLSQAWDLAFAWLADEPGQHHPALPLSVLLSMTSIALMWGWVFEAGAICLAWCGILRIGEVLLAQRRDLILPCDSMPGIHFILLKIKLPKTRGRSAKHQAAKIDACDIVELLSAIYADLPPDAPLWPFSASTLRKRFNSLLEALNLDTKRTIDGRPFGLGSLRAGGATHLLLETENPDLVRRRGRWLAHRTMEIYLQEVLVTTFTSKLQAPTRDKIYVLASVFPKVAVKAILFLRSAIPTQVWYQLFQADDAEELG